MVVFAIAFTACETRYNYIDTGLSNGVHNCTMYEYFEKDSYNWDSLRKMIDRAGLTDMFNGLDPQCEKMMFFGLTNHSIREWMWAEFPIGDKLYESINDINPRVCRQLVLQHVVPNKILMRIDVPVGIKGASADKNVGGMYLSPLEGDPIFLWAQVSSWEGVPNAGPKMLFIHLNDLVQKDVASADIQTNTGVVHAMHYTYKIDPNIYK